MKTKCVYLLLLGVMFFAFQDMMSINISLGRRDKGDGLRGGGDATEFVQTDLNNQVLSFTFKKSASNVTVQVKSFSGTVVFQQTLSVYNGYKLNVDLSHCAEGPYYIIIDEPDSKINGEFYLE